MKKRKLKGGPVCPCCDARLTGYTGVTKDVHPRPEDVTICLHCRNLLVFTEDLGLRKAIDSDLDDYLLQDLARAREVVKQRQY